MNYKEVIKAQLEEFQSNGFDRTFTPIYRRKDTFPFTEIDFSQESKIEEKELEEARAKENIIRSCEKTLA